MLGDCMILVIGFEKEEFSKLKNILSEFKIYGIPEYCRDWVVEEVIEKAPSFKANSNWHWRKFILMHGIPNEKVKRTDIPKRTLCRAPTKTNKAIIIITITFTGRLVPFI